jgi:polygalacturonase
MLAKFKMSLGHAEFGGSLAFVAAGAVILGAHAAHASASVRFPDRICDVRAYGAVGAKLRPDTIAFQSAIDDCAAKGGGTVLVPRGWYLIGPISLRSNIRLEVTKYAEIRFETEPSLYGTTRAPVTPEGKGADRALINITDVSNVAITGVGLIDGQGPVWWEWIRDYWKDAEASRSGKANQAQRVTRPRLILARNAQNLLFEGVRLENAPSFHLVLTNTDHVTIRGLTIQSPGNSPNTDAIDPTGSRDVLIENNTISTGDDVIAIKGNGPDPRFPDDATANITIRKNLIRQGHGVSIGSGTSGGVKHVLIENNRFEGSLHGFRIKTRRGFGGEVSDIVVRNNVMRDVQNVLTISSYFEYAPLDEREAERQVEAGGFLVLDLFYPPESDPARPFVENQTPEIHDVTIKNLKATGAENAGLIIGLPEREIRGVKLDNVSIQANRGLVVRNAQVVTRGVKLSVTGSPPLILQRHGSVAAAR